MTETKIAGVKPNENVKYKTKISILSKTANSSTSIICQKAEFERMTKTK